ncbi:MAG: glycosyltransferase [Actinomycetota bacterium]|nr:glycosyltransferase [Actinomycetota bacterium]
MSVAVVSDDRVCIAGDGRYYSSTGYDWRRVADMFGPDRPHFTIYCRLFDQPLPPPGWSSVDVDGRIAVVGLPWFHKYTFLLRFPGAVRQLRRGLKGADLVWLVVPNLYSILAYIVARSLRKRVLAWAVGDIEETALLVYDEWPIRLSYRLYSAVTRAIVRRADVAAVASATLDRKYCRGRESVVAYRSFRDPLLLAMERPVPEDGPRTILYVGRLSREKGPETLLEAMSSVVESTPGARLIVAGDGPLRGPLEERARARGLAGHVEFVGWVGSLIELRDLFERADVFCLPSYTEGMPAALLEALSARLPVVVTRVGDMPALVETTGVGRVVPPADAAALSSALLEVLGSAGEWRSMSDNAARVAAENSLERQTGKVVAAARAILDRPVLAS